MGTGVSSSTEKLSYFIEEALGLRICLLAGNLCEFLQKFLLLSSQIRRRLHYHPNVFVPSSRAAQMRNATSSQSKRLAGLSPSRNLHLHFAVERRHFDLSFQGRLGKGHRHFAEHLTPLAYEDRMRPHMHHHVQIAWWATALTRLSLARHPDPSPRIPSRRNSDLQFRFALVATRPAAFGAGVRDDLPGATALVARTRDRDKSLG